MTKLIIARHGNTFEAHEDPCRVGLRTDLPLVKTGEQQARDLATHLKKQNMLPDEVYSSNLRRAYNSAELMCEILNHDNKIHVLDMFNEVDYGPDENKPEYEVIARIGQQAIQDWDEKGIVPDGWNIDTDMIIDNWQTFSMQIRAFEEDQTILVVTSNGIARFAPAIASPSGHFNPEHSLKLRTGAFGLLEHTSQGWIVREWNVRP